MDSGDRGGYSGDYCRDVEGTNMSYFGGGEGREGYVGDWGALRTPKISRLVPYR